MTVGVSSGGVSLTLQIGRQGLPGPPGPQSPFGLSVDTITSDQTATLLATLTAIPIGLVGVQIVDGYITAQDQASGDVAVWQVVMVARRNADGSLTWPGDPTDGTQASNPGVTRLIIDPSMAAVVLAPVLGSVGIEVNGYGLAGRELRWTGSLVIGGNFT